MPIQHNVDKGTETLIRELLQEFNLPFSGSDDYTPLTLAFNEDNSVVGGLLGGTYWGYLTISILVIKPDYRHRGYGSMLLNTAEKVAVDRGCQHATLETHDFQGLTFYEKHGYSSVGQLPDLPPGHTKYILHKSLST